MEKIGGRQLGVEDLLKDIGVDTSRRKGGGRKKKDKKENAYRVIGNKIFQSKSDWKDVKRIVKEKFDVDLSNYPPKKQIELINRAAKGETKVEKECSIPDCDKVHKYPRFWNLVEFNGLAFCEDHSIKEVKDYLNEKNKTVYIFD